jgi:hypothetical protein
VTHAPRLVVEMREKAARLKERAAGYRFAGERRLARSADMAADRLEEACAALALLADREKDL